MHKSIMSLTVAGLLSFTTASMAQADLPIKAPAGVLVEKIADLDTPRFLAFSKSGDMIVGSGAGQVFRLKAPYTESEVLVDFGSYPHSVAFREIGGVEELWIGDTVGIYKAAYNSTKSYAKADFELVAALPGGSGHSSRTVKVREDGTVFVSLGIAGNCSPQFLGNSFAEGDRRGGIYRLDESVTPAKLVPFGTGLRNPIGINFHPTTGVMYANNNGPDHWGFDAPREVFVEVQDGDFFGMPWYQTINGEVKVDSCAPQDKAPKPITDVEKSVATFDARSAPMETLFVPQGYLKSEWANSALVALHGSWAVPQGGGDADRREPKIVLVEFADGKATGKVTDLLTGFQFANGERFARPVGLAFGPDKALYMTSDAENPGVYKVSLDARSAAPQATSEKKAK